MCKPTYKIQQRYQKSLGSDSVVDVTDAKQIKLKVNSAQKSEFFEVYKICIYNS